VKCKDYNDNLTVTGVLVEAETCSIFVKKNCDSRDIKYQAHSYYYKMELNDMERMCVMVGMQGQAGRGSPKFLTCKPTSRRGACVRRPSGSGGGTRPVRTHTPGMCVKPAAVECMRRRRRRSKGRTKPAGTGRRFDDDARSSVRARLPYTESRKRDFWDSDRFKKSIEFDEIIWWTQW
jgi:hypothetical protein